MTDLEFKTLTMLMNIRQWLCSDPMKLAHLNDVDLNNRVHFINKIDELIAEERAQRCKADEPTIKPDDLLHCIQPAEYQRSNKEKLRAEAKQVEYDADKAELISEINNLWRVDGAYLTFWKGHWFPGHVDFLSHLQTLGYHVYTGTEANRSNISSNCFIISLDELPYEEWRKGEDLCLSKSEITSSTQM